MSEDQAHLSHGLDHPERVSHLQLAVVASRFNEVLVAALVDDALQYFSDAGVKEAIEIVRVPGAHELPFAVNLLCQQDRFDAILALGVVIGGETEHHQVIAYSTSHAFQRIAVDQKTPVINGVIVTESQDQARARSSGSKARGAALAQTALDMAVWRRGAI